jgi:dTDP-4-amino-4,6-dideoxygalactose transaminase
MTSSRSRVRDLAILGGAPAFAGMLPVGQMYFPAFEDYEAKFRDIFARQYYTNHGPLAQEFERRLETFFGVRHVICVTNATIGLIMAAEALGLTGKVVTPSFTFIATAQALEWANLRPVFCDVDPATHHVTPALIEPHLDENVSAILAVNLWGGCCDQSALKTLAAERNLQLFYDSAHAFGCSWNNIPIGRFGAVEAFSFHATKVLSSAEGGCLTTDDDELAKRLRNIRSSYGAGPQVPVTKTSNGRMSEAQAAIGLMSLDNFSNIVSRNKALFALYRTGLADVAGLRLLEPVNVSQSNFQYIVVEVDDAEFGLPRDLLLKALKAENVVARRYFFPGAHRSIPWVERNPKGAALSNTDRLCANLIQFPIGALVLDKDVERLCDLLRIIKARAFDIRKAARRRCV